MNLRILKKLSKRAVPYLERIGGYDMPFPARSGENSTSYIVRDLTRLDRCPSCHTEVFQHDMHVGTLSPKRRKGTKYPFVKLSWPSTPLKGTPMFGWVSGYYEPEWEEETAWFIFKAWVVAQHTDYDAQNFEPTVTRRFHSPADYFRAADQLLNP